MILRISQSTENKCELPEPKLNSSFPPHCLSLLHVNRLLVMRMHNLYGTEKESEESSDEESDEEDDEERKPQLELAMLPHYGGINRVRVSVLVTIYPCRIVPITIRC